MGDYLQLIRFFWETWLLYITNCMWICWFYVSSHFNLISV
jgi:hypothetical protein